MQYTDIVLAEVFSKDQVAVKVTDFTDAKFDMSIADGFYRCRKGPAAQGVDSSLK